MNITELKKIIDDHQLWASSLGEQGDRAGLENANLKDVDLSGANLKGIYLGNADLSGANLSGANLNGAYLEGAHLENACLLEAKLIDANLEGADLRGANLRGANLTYANLNGAHLKDADLEDACLLGANIIESYPSNNDRDIPRISNIHQKLYQAVQPAGALNMDDWHTCDTTHCKAGWIVTLAGAKGKQLEAMYGTSTAAYWIYRASDRHNLLGAINFYGTNATALEELERLSDLEAQQSD
jgi:uncharacterized protein YjbI with pentapeptide repeats